MQVQIFGQLTDITGTRLLELSPVPDTDTLIREIGQRFPEMSRQTFTIAVDRKMISSNLELREGMDIALMPPFSGG